MPFMTSSAAGSDVKAAIQNRNVENLMEIMMVGGEEENGFKTVFRPSVPPESAKPPKAWKRAWRPSSVETDDQ